jgi:hypothetical protein
VEGSREGKKIVERICFSQHLLRGVISTARPLELLGLELQDVRLYLAEFPCRCSHDGAAAGSVA